MDANGQGTNGQPNSSSEGTASVWKKATHAPINSPGGGQDPQDQQEERRKSFLQQTERLQQEQSTERTRALLRQGVQITGVAAQVMQDAQQQTQQQAAQPMVVKVEQKDMSLLRKLNTGLPVVIPNGAADSIEEYRFFDQKVSSMWKAHGRAKRIPDTEAARMKRHVDRFMASSEIHEEDVSKMSTKVLQSSKILSVPLTTDTIRQESVETKKRMEIVDKLKDNEDGSEVANILSDSDSVKLLKDSDLPWDNKYYTEHPAAARVLILMNLLQNVDHTRFNLSGFKANSRFEDRINGLIENLTPLCELIKNSEAYLTAKDQTATAQDQQRQLALSADQKEMFESGIAKRMKRLSKACDRWEEYLKKNRTETTDSIREKYMQMLELHEEDMLAFQKMTGVDTSLLARVGRYQNELKKLRIYFGKLQPETVEERQEKRRMGSFSERWKKKNHFYGTTLRQKLIDKKLKKVPSASDEDPKQIDKIYSSEVIESVKEIDQWVSAHLMDTAESDTESNFASELLNKPFSQRLFAYYLIEKKRRHEPSTSCVMLALNDYVPNLKQFKKAMVATRAKAWLRPAGKLKKLDAVRNTKVLNRYLGTTGKFYLSKIEDTLKLLNDPEAKYVERIDVARKEREASKKEPDDSLFKKRHDKYIECMRAFEEFRVNQCTYQRWKNHVTHKKMIESQDKARSIFTQMNGINQSIKDEYQRKLDSQRQQGQGGGANQGQTPQQPEITARQLKQMITADGHAAGFTEEKELNEGVTREHMSDHDKADKVFEVSEDLIGKALEADGAVTEWANKTEFWMKVWDLPTERAVDSALAGGVMGSLAGLIQVTQAISSMVTIGERAIEEGWSGVLEQSFETAEKLSDATTSITTAAYTFDKLYDFKYQYVYQPKNEVPKSVGGFIGDIPGVKAVNAVGNVIQFGNGVREVFTVGISGKKQREGETAAKSVLQDRADQETDEQKKNALLANKKRVENIRKMQHLAHKRRTEQAIYKMTNASLGIIGTFAPGADVFTTPASQVVTMVASFREFYAKMKESDSTIDNYIDMGELLAAYKEEFDNDDAELQAQVDEVIQYKKEKRRDDVLKDEIRQAVLRELGFSSYGEFAENIAEEYSKSIHDLIFLDDANEEIVDDERLDQNQRPKLEGDDLKEPLTKLFSPLTFRYKTIDTKGKEHSSKPSVNAMKESLLK